MNKASPGFLFACLVIGSAAHAQTCNQERSASTISQAKQAGIISGYDMAGGTMNLYVDQSTWAQLDAGMRRTMAFHFQCAVVGPDKVLREISVKSSGGLLLAKWDGVKRDLEVLR